MKKASLLTVAVLMIFSFLNVSAQQIPYQAVARSASGNLIQNQTVSLRFTIHSGSAGGTSVFQETGSATTNEFGLFTYNIGTNANLSGVNWASSTMFMQVEMDPTGGTSYTNMGTQQMLYVPYALYSLSSGSGAGTTGPTGAAGANGTNGAAGPTGAAGTNGTNGTNGVNGATGPTGPSGANGTNGATGAAGTNGANGTNGTNGATGPTGLAGANGTNGANGATGPTGAAGANGTNGATGAAGTNGTDGATGPTGAAGSNGTDGTTGPTGANGTDGSTGVTGPTGPAGSLPAGVAGSIPYYNGSSWVVNATNIYDDGGDIGIGLTSPFYPLHVSGTNSTAVGFFNNLATSALGAGVAGYTNSTSGVGVYGFASVAAAASLSTVGVEGISSTSSSASGSSNIGVVGIGNSNTVLSIGVDGESSTNSGIGVRGLVSGSATGGMAVYGHNISTAGGSVSYGVYGDASGSGSGSQHYGVYGIASGGTFNIAGFFGGGGELVMSESPTVSGTAPLSRSFPGSTFESAASTTVATGGRIWWSVSGFNWYVNSTGSADYSEYFATKDPSLAVGEVVAIDPELANGVRRARPVDAPSTLGIVSFGGTRNNDNRAGNRNEDPNYVNVGFTGQVPVVVTTENGDIKPGDALTMSARYRGRAVKATGPCRIIGYAMTHFPYTGGEKDYEDDILGGSLERLTADHVMCYLNVGWYEPANAVLGQGEELPALESARDMDKRLSGAIVPPRKAEMDARDAKMKEEIAQRANSPASQPTVPKAPPGIPAAVTK